MTISNPSPAPIPAGSPFIHYQDNQLYMEQVSLKELAQLYGTPLYVYSRAALQAAWQRYQEACELGDVVVCFGMKANSNLAILQEFARLGAGFDLVSGGELARALKAGADASKIVFSGVGKQAWEIEAGLQAKIKCFNVESIPELDLISAVATRMGVSAPISLRVNPDVDAKTHPYISTGLKENKFGIDILLAPEVYAYAKTLPGLDVVGVDCHIGSQITEMSPFLDAADKLIDLLDRLRNQDIQLHHVDIGGGLGIRYTNEEPVHPKDLVAKVLDKLRQRGYQDMQLVMEPGRSLVGNSGLLLSQVQFVKTTEARNFAIVDAAMNDLLRPTLYDAYHGVLALEHKAGEALTYDVVGPICESGDWLAKQRDLVIEAGDYLAVESAGAYGFTMASQYNTRPRAAEVLVDGDKHYLIRERETFEHIFGLDRML